MIHLRIAQTEVGTEEDVILFLEDAHPRFDTIMRVLKAMGRLTIAPCVAEKQTMYLAK